MPGFTPVDEIVHEAGRIALGKFERVAVEFKADHSPVTEADRAVESFIRARLTPRYPGTGFLGEEGGGKVAPRTFILDPIDGTSAFAAGFPIWGIALAYAVGPAVEAGWLHLPVLDRLYTCRDGIAKVNGKRLLPGNEPASPEEATLLVSSTWHHEFRIDFPGKIRSFGSTAAHALYAASGRAAGCLLGRVHIWDIACALPLLAIFGSALAHLDGEPVDMTALFATGRLPRPALLARSAQTLHALLPRIHQT